MVSAAAQVVQSDTVMIVKPVWDKLGTRIGESRVPRPCLHRIGDWCVIHENQPSGRHKFLITHAPSGKCASAYGHADLSEAKRYADAFAVVLAGRDPTVGFEDFQVRQSMLRSVRELAEKAAQP